MILEHSSFDQLMSRQPVPGRNVDQVESSQEVLQDDVPSWERLECPICVSDSHAFSDTTLCSCCDGTGRGRYDFSLPCENCN